MPYRDLEPISKQLTIVIGLTVVGFMAFGLALSFYRNVLFEDTLRKIEDQNRSLSENIDHRYDDLEYYRSAQYRDKYAKENLNKLAAGEKVMIITQKPGEFALPLGSDVTPTEHQQAAFEELLREMPVMDHWKLFLLYREKIDELKRGL